MSIKLNVGNALRRGKSREIGYGSKAQTIYDQCCDKFHWDRTKRGLFGPQQELYAEGATPEGFSPWFLPHNNWTKTKGETWYNIIFDNTIEEIWKRDEPGLYHDGTMRVTFAKTEENIYVFLGIYKPDLHKIEEITLDGKRVWVKPYERIADVYPEIIK